MFANRTEAGRRLAEALRDRHAPDALVLGVPRGGVVVASEVAGVLGLELDVVVVRKLGAPGQPEYAIGAVDEEGHVVGATSFPDQTYVRTAAIREREEIARRLAAYRGDRPPATIAGREVLLVDDGVATGFTVRAAVESTRRRGAGRVVVAAPVASPQAAATLRREADEVVTLEEPPDFYAVGQFYRDFTQTSDAEVVRLLATVPRPGPSRPRSPRYRPAWPKPRGSGTD